MKHGDPIEVWSAWAGGEFPFPPSMAWLNGYNFEYIFGRMAFIRVMRGFAAGAIVCVPAGCVRPKVTK